MQSIHQELLSSIISAKKPREGGKKNVGGKKNRQNSHVPARTGACVCVCGARAPGLLTLQTFCKKKRREVGLLISLSPHSAADEHIVTQESSVHWVALF